jgi:hypothetical protein
MTVNQQCDAPEATRAAVLAKIVRWLAATLG